MTGEVGEGEGPLWRCELTPALDWVQLELTLARPSQPRHLRQRLPRNWGNVYVHPVDGPQSSRRFVFRVQDPHGPHRVMADIQSLALPGDGPILEDQIQVVGMEVALDAYPCDCDPTLLVDAAFHMVWHLAHPPAGQLLVTEPAHFRADARMRSLQQALSEGWSLNIAGQGRKGEATLGSSCAVDALRAYVKTHDSSEIGAYRRMPHELHRARLERTLLGTVAPFSTMAGWRAFRFEKLARLFAMCQTDPKASQFMKLLHTAGGPLGQPLDTRLQAGHRRIRRPGTRRDSALNERIRVSLRKLTRAQHAEIRTADGGADHLVTRQDAGLPGCS